MGKTVAITGVSSYFASTVLPLLAADPGVDRIVGIDLVPPRTKVPKLSFHAEDIRSPKLAEILQGADTLFHLAFVVAEIHDKKKTFDVNINGSRNVFSAAVLNGVRKVVYTSSATAYGAHATNPLCITEERPLTPNQDSYYSLSKFRVESLAREFFAGHPDTLFTVLRAGLCVGPRTRNMFHGFWTRKASIFPGGRAPHLQFIHEEDLGTALFSVYEKDLPGVYNVASDDAVSSFWVFEKAGVRLLKLPAGVLKKAANAAFALRLEKVSQGWLSLSEHTIHMSSEKFKKEAGWAPRWTSEQAFLDYLAHRND
ncbi:MAG: NAD-dependent epimerase/dehydratase family protein [Thermodesulfobacteriota bacterium]